MRRFIDKEVMARQVLNCELAISLAADAGCDWILHIDVDEALLCEAGNAPMLFERLDADGVNQATFKNFEALPEQTEVDDYFREVTLFKVNPNRMGKVRFGPTQIALARQAHFFRGDNFNFYFNLYATGKSAGKIDPFLIPVDVHNFTRRLQFKQQIDCKTRILGDNAIILHYPNCGLQNFITKYKTLGDFRDRWFGNNEVFPFHREARDICATGDDEAVIKFYRERVRLHPHEDLERLLGHGILARITAPADMIEHLKAGGPSTGSRRD
jgi:hypothetical protein